MQVDTHIHRDCDRRACKAHCLEAGGCQSPAHCRSTTETALLNHPLLPLVPPPIALPSVRGLAPPSNMFVTPSLPIQLQIDPALQATAPQVTSAPPPSLSISTHANAPFASHMSSIFTERWTTEQRLREEQREQTPLVCEKFRSKTHHLVYVWVQVCYQHHFLFCR